MSTETRDIQHLVSPRYDANYEREGGDGACILCGKSIKGKSAGHLLCVQGTIYTVANPEDEDEWVEHDAGFMGCHPIGPKCQRKLLKDGTVPESWVVNLTLRP
ncbi:hypothetical protein N9917_00390 [Deltaproteobacteria bacterium]|nr:hypothetical protein [Deltaproteobacteria bacterium]